MKNLFKYVTLKRIPAVAFYAFCGMFVFSLLVSVTLTSFNDASPLPTDVSGCYKGTHAPGYVYCQGFLGSERVEYFLALFSSPSSLAWWILLGIFFAPLAAIVSLDLASSSQLLETLFIATLFIIPLLIIWFLFSLLIWIYPFQVLIKILRKK